MKLTSTTKKLAAIALASALASSIAACGSDDSPEGAQGSPSSSAQSSAEKATNEAEEVAWPSDASFFAERMEGVGGLSGHEVSAFSLTEGPSEPEEFWSLGLTASPEGKRTRGDAIAKGMSGKEIVGLLQPSDVSLWRPDDCSAPIHPDHIYSWDKGVTLHFGELPDTALGSFQDNPGFLTFGDENMCEAAAAAKEEKGAFPVSRDDAIGLSPSKPGPFSAHMILGSKQ